MIKRMWGIGRMLKPSFIIFICIFDLFGSGRQRNIYRQKLWLWIPEVF